MRIAWLTTPILALPLALVACAYSLTPPRPSHLALDLPPGPPRIAISLVDERPAEVRSLAFVEWDSFGRFPPEEKPTDPPPFLARQVQVELESRGLPVTVEVADRGLPRIRLRTFRVRGYRQKLELEEIIARVLISADLETSTGSKRIGVFTAGVDEFRFAPNDAPIVAAVSDPVAMAIKEFSAKLANELYGYQSPDATVRQIADEIEIPINNDTYRNLYALGFTNNPLAIPLAARIAEHPEVLNNNPDKWTNISLVGGARIAAVSSLGTLHATSQLALLESLYENKDLGWRTRCMAAKSIGDLGNPEALAYLAAQLASGTISPARERGAFLAQVIELYL